MRQAWVGVSCVLMGLALSSCQKGSDDIGERFVVRLAGANEVPARGTAANGVIGLNVIGNRVDYSIEVHGIGNIIGAHLHSGAAGVNGPIRIALFPGPGSNFTTTPLSPGDGQLYEGSFEASDVNGISFSDLLAGMRAGTVYGNVHTTQFPGGEMRGQVQVLP
jgi:CHRD domain-containing protein